MPIPPPTPDEQKALDFADAALGAAGHEVDPQARERALLVLRGELTIEDAVALDIAELTGPKKQG